MRKPLNLIAISILSLIALGACTYKGSSTSVFWVNSVKVFADAGNTKRLCLQVTRQKELKNPEWEIFYNDIKGFEPKAGFFQKIEVLETQIPQDSVTADGSSVRYSLIKVLEEKPDSKWRLNDIWTLVAVNGKEIKLSKDQKRPQLEFELGEMKVFGTDGCNQLTGGLESLTAEKIVLGKLATTLMLCPDMTVPDAFMEALDAVKTYEIKDSELTFYDADKKELLRFKNAD